MNRKAIVHTSLSASTLILFVWLLSSVMAGSTLPFDMSVRAQIHGIASAPLTVAMKVFTFTGSTMWISTVCIAALLMLYPGGHKQDAIVLAIVMAGALLLNGGLKTLIHRPRPLPFFNFPEPSSFSFPSGHALFSAAFYGTLAYVVSRRGMPRRQRTFLWIGAMILIALICLSRVYLGVHYPTDVAGGVLISCFWVNAVLACTTSPSS